MEEHKCPACGSRSTIPILYGLPLDEACDAAKRGEIALGGCLVWPDQPTHSCTSCGERFREPGSSGEWPLVPVLDEGESAGTEP